jgi:uncharacterized protein
LGRKKETFAEFSTLSNEAESPGLPMKERVLIVDGHSMIFQWPDLAALHTRNPALARETLIRTLDGLRDATDQHVLLVFDGQGNRPNEASEPHHIQVFYSKSGQTADSIIERLVAKYAETYDVTVATDDRLEQTTVATFGGSTISSTQLQQEVAAAQSALGDRLKRLHRPRS